MPVRGVPTARGFAESLYCRLPHHPRWPVGIGIQHKSKSLRNKHKKRVRTRKHKLRSAKKAKRLKAGRIQARNA